MSRITKTLAEQVARELTNEQRKVVDKLRLELRELITEAIRKNIPIEVLNVYDKYPNYFNTASHSRLTGAGFSHEYYNFNQVPSNRNGFKIAAKDAEKIISISNLVEDKRKEYKKLFEEIEIALIGLKTYNNVEREFPEAFKFLPAKEVTALAVDLKSIRCKIDSRNCK